MIKLNYNFKAIGPLHTGSDTNCGTMKVLRRQACILPEAQAYESWLTEENRRDALVHICLGVWYSIDWDKIKGNRLMGIWDEFYNKLLSAGRAQNKYQFLENLTRSWGIEGIRNKNVLSAIDSISDEELLYTVRNEAMYICLKLRAIKDKAKEHKDETGMMAFDIKPIVKLEKPILVTKIRDEIPCISGNSFRGKMRRIAMHDFCQRSGIAKMDKRIYHILFSGGFLDQSTKFEDFDKMDTFVKMCPMLGLFGAAIGNMVIEGEMKVGWAYPLCRERGTSIASFWNSIDTVFQTRKDSSKTEKEIDLTGENQTQQMKYEYEVFCDGTIFEHRIACTSPHSLLKSSFWHLLDLFKKEPNIGGMSSVGNGEILPEFTIDINECKEYIEYVDLNKTKIKSFWEDLKI